MAKFDIESYEENKRRKVIMRKFAKLTHNTQTTLLEIIASDATRTDIFKTCITCKHFEVLEPIGGDGELIEHCKLVGKRPPAKVIADGCEEYKERYFHDDDIPF